MKAFFKAVMANIVAHILVWAMVGIVLLIGLVFLAALTRQGKPSRIQSNSVLVLDLSMNIVDTPPVSSAAETIKNAIEGPMVPTFSLLEIEDAIDRAGKDQRICALFIYGSLVPDGMVAAGA